MSQRFKTIWPLIQKRLTKKNVIITIGIIIILTLLISLIPRSVAFSFASKKNCFSQIAFLPKILKNDSNPNFSLNPSDEINLFNHPIISKKLCLDVKSAPKTGSHKLSISPLGVSILKRSFEVKVPQAPQPKLTVLDKPIAATRPLKVPMTKKDSIFAYSLVSNKKQTTCESSSKSLNCDLEELNLKQGSKYEVVIDRHFEGEKTATIASKEIETLKATKITKTSVKNNQTIYSKPRSFTYKTDKKVTSADVKIIQIGSKDDKKEIPSEVKVTSTGFVVSVEKDFSRQKQFQIIVSSVDAIDGSSLEKPHKTLFKTSGGPQVTNVNIGRSGVVPGTVVVVQLDQPLKDGLDISKFVSVKGVNAVLSKNTNQILITLNNLKKCQDFTVVVKKGLVSKYNISSDTGWSYSSRSRCHDIGTIGYSVQGRPINAYYFGSGATTMLFTGAIHGNEQSSLQTMNAWISNLESRAKEIPAGRRIVIVPNVNPDGSAIGRRDNARGVNLNRNFATSNWEKDIQTSGGVDKGGGGPSGNSEPETRALASLSSSLAPRLVITYHSSGSLVNSNDVGISLSAGQRYASTVGYRFVPNSGTTAAFGFEMTGTYEDWLGERGIGAFLIELPTDYGNYFYNHQSAIWSAIKS